MREERDILEVDFEFGVQPAELRPHHPVEGPFEGAHHDGRAPLPRIPVIR